MRRDWTSWRFECDETWLDIHKVLLKHEGAPEAMESEQLLRNRPRTLLIVVSLQVLHNNT